MIAGQLKSIAIELETFVVRFEHSDQNKLLAKMKTPNCEMNDEDDDDDNGEEMIKKTNGISKSLWKPQQHGHQWRCLWRLFTIFWLAIQRTTSQIFHAKCSNERKKKKLLIILVFIE